VHEQGWLELVVSIQPFKRYNKTRYSRCQVIQECKGCLIGSGAGSGGGGWSGRDLRIRLVLRGTVRHAGRVGMCSSGGGAGGLGGGGASGPGPGIGGFLLTKMRKTRVDGHTVLPVRTELPFWFIFRFHHHQIPKFTRRDRRSDPCISSSCKTYCWILRRSSRSLPTSPRSIRTSVASALLNSSRY